MTTTDVSGNEDLKINARIVSVISRLEQIVTDLKVIESDMKTLTVRTDSMKTVRLVQGAVGTLAHQLLNDIDSIGERDMHLAAMLDAIGYTEEDEHLDT